MPYKAVAREGRICLECRRNGNKTDRIPSSWHHIWIRMQEMKNWDSLSSYIKTLPPFPPFDYLEGNKHLENYKRDCLAHSLIPTDCPMRREDTLPVYTTGDGNCFIYSLSQLRYGHEDHYVEMKV